MSDERSNLRAWGGVSIVAGILGLLLVFLYHMSSPPVIGIGWIFLPSFGIGSIIFGVGLLFMPRETTPWSVMSAREKYIEDFGNAPRVASWASVVCFCTGVIPVCILLMLWINTRIPDRSDGEMGDLGWLFILGILSLQAFVLSGIGIGLGIWAICKSRWLWGKLGIILNAALPVLCVLVWLNLHHIRDFYPWD